MKYDLDLRININSLIVKPADILYYQDAKKAGFKKVGFLGRYLLGFQRGSKVYHAKNCKMSCLEDRFSITPNPRINFPPPSQLNINSGKKRTRKKKDNIPIYTSRYAMADMNGVTFPCKTSAYYFLEKDNTIREINFQLLDNIFLSGDEYSNFIETCSSQFGDPIFWNEEGPVKKSSPGVTAGWRGTNSCVYANLSKDEKHLMIIWLKNLI